jgi:putative nucleotidyltransferase with HDIG domain
VLLVGDFVEDALSLQGELEHAGYSVALERVETAEALEVALLRGRWDVVLSDYQLATFSAPEALKLCQQSGYDVPFIVVSGAIGEDAAVEVMKAGASDYVMKNRLSRLGPAIARGLGDAAVRRERRSAEERIRRSSISLAETVGRAMEPRDPYTVGHQRRVAELSRLVGRRLGCSQAQQEGLYVGGLLHDIGKMAIPESILTKPGRLTPEEWELVKEHVVVGCDVLRKADLPWPVAEMALRHHERLDGSGYPGGLRGDSLQFEARLLAACNVVEAMASHRPYRPASSLASVWEEMRLGKGRLYDERVVEAIEDVIQNDEFRLVQ